jgi:hypothetical protein
VKIRPFVLAGIMLAGGLSTGRAEEPSRLDGDEIGRKIVLPPFLVSDTRIGGITWHYLSAPGFEAISCLPAEATAAQFFATTIFRMEELQGTLIPPELSFQERDPMKMILLKPGMEKIMAREMVDVMHTAMLKDSARSMTSMGDLAGATFQAIPQMNLLGPDSVTMLCVLEGDAEDYRHIVLTQDYVVSLLAGRKPALPAWFIYGTRDLYTEMEQEHPWERPEIDLPRMKWPYRADALRPMRSFLAGSFDPAGNWVGDGFGAWCMEAEFFLHWAYADESHHRRDALWRFVDRSSRQPVTEALFRQCFGVGFEEMDAILSRYVSRGGSSSKLADTQDAFKIPRVRYRDATRPEIARIKGDFTLKEVTYLQESYPDALIGAYLDQAGSELLSCYAQGSRDPAFLAVLAKYYRAAGKATEAEAVLRETGK